MHYTWKKYLSCFPLPQIVLCFASNFLEVQLEERIALWEIPEGLSEKLER